MIERLKGILVQKAPPWARQRVCEALPRALSSARPWMAGQVCPAGAFFRHGWQTEAVP